MTAMGETALKQPGIKSEGYFCRLARDLKRHKGMYLLVLPVIAFYIIFHYVPMYGAVIAFEDYIPAKGVLGSQWVGLQHFAAFFQSHYFWRILKNTLLISFNSILFGFPAPILLALLLNEVANDTFKRVTQTVTYMPHFVSLVVICGLVRTFTMDTGVINYVIGLFGGEKVSLLNVPGAFVPIYIISDIWQQVGWGSIIYIAAIAGIDQSLYEAAIMDGAGRFKQAIYVTLPSIMPTIVVLLILKIGGLLNVGFEKIILLYNPVTYETADVISTFVYRKGLLEFNYSYSAAVGLFNSVINCVLLITSNAISKKVNGMSLW